MNLYDPYDPGPSAAPPRPAGPAAAAAPAPYTTPAPNSWLRGQLQSQAQRAYDAAKAKLAGQRTDLLTRYGYTQGPNGELSVNANSPYGLIQSMYRNHAQQADQTEHEQRSRGFAGLHGVAGQVLSRMRTQQGSEANDLGTSLSRGLTENEDALRDAGVDYQNALSNADIEATRDAVANEQFNPANMSNLDPETEPGPTPKSVVKGPGGSQVLWGGNYLTKQQLVNTLRKRGVSVAGWAKKHPAAARALGF